MGIARRDGVTLGVVLLDSPELGRQAERLLDAGFYDIYHLPPAASSARAARDVRRLRGAARALFFSLLRAFPALCARALSTAAFGISVD